MFFKPLCPTINDWIDAPDVYLPQPLPSPSHGIHLMQEASDEGAGGGNKSSIASSFFSLLPPYLPLPLPPPKTTLTPSPSGCPSYAFLRLPHLLMLIQPKKLIIQYQTLITHLTTYTLNAMIMTAMTIHPHQLLLQPMRSIA